MGNRSIHRFSGTRCRFLAALALVACLSARAQAGDLDASSIVAGAFHICAVVNGGAQCWGDNFDGQLGDGTFRDSSSPVAVSGLQSGVTAIAGGGYHTCALVNGGVKCWGFNGDGELGNGSQNSSGVPVAVQGLTSGVVAIAAGSYHTCAVLSGGTVRCWGWNSEGELGDNTTNATNTNPPVTVVGISSGATAVAAGDAFTCAIVGGGVKCWGNNAWGQLDDGTLTARHTAVTALSLSGIASISAGLYHTCAIGTDTSVHCWGRNEHGQLGNNSVLPTGTNPPVQPSGISSGVTSIAAGWNFTCATVGGTAKCWGSNFYGELGDGTLTERHVPGTVSGLASGSGAVAAGAFSACALVPASHQTRCWGDNIDGEAALGWADVITRSVPQSVTAIASATALAHGSLAQHSCAIVGGAAKCWGDNDWGEIGDGTFVPRSTPVGVTGLTSGVTEITIGNLHTCAIVAGAAKCWGNNDHGQLGIGSSGGLSNVPVTAIASGVTAIAAGVWHTCAIVGSGVQCWGYNNDGQLGNGSTASSSTPVSVNLGGTPVALAAGGWHTCAVLSNGTIKCWGYNGSGQLGNNTNQSTLTGPPVTVSNIASGATALAGGYYHTCAIVSGGARCWGYNNDGQMGNGTTTNSLVPVTPAGLASGVSTLSAGSWHVCAIVNGAVSCWGWGFHGQLGNGSFDNRKTPTPVSGLAANATALSGGDYHACALVGGKVKCWGADYFGELGIGRIVYTPVAQIPASSSDSPAVACGGPVQVNLNVLPTSQAQSQPFLFSVTIGNVAYPSATVAMYSGTSVVCLATMYGDPRASCWGYLSLGTHPITAVYSDYLSTGCSSPPVDVTATPDTGLLPSSLTLSAMPGASAQPAATATPDANTATSSQQGDLLTLTATIAPQAAPAAGPGNGTTASTATTYSGFVVFYDGTTEIASVPVENDTASFTNRFVGGTHQFSASYSGDGANTTSGDTDAVVVTTPADDIFYNGLEIPPQ